MNDIFISYASADRPTARALAVRLEQEGWSVWWDRKIPPGQSFAKVLEQALISARCVVVLWSKTSCASDWVQNEAAEGKRRNILVPAFIEDTSPPFEFRRIQAANLVGWEQQAPGSELDALFDAVKRILDGETAAPEPNPSSPGLPGPADTSPQETADGDVRSPLWQTGLRLILFSLVSGLLIMGLFKKVYPQAPVTEALTTILVLSIIAGAALNASWGRWRRFNSGTLRRRR